MKKIVFILLLFTTQAQAQGIMGVLAARKGSAKSSGVTISQPSATLHVVDSGGTSLTASRVDFADIIQLPNGSYFGLHNWFPAGGGGDTDTAYLKSFTSVNGSTWTPGDTLKRYLAGQMNAHLGVQEDGDIILLSLIKRSTAEERTYIGMQKSTDGGLTFSAPVEISDSLYGDAWIPAAGRLRTNEHDGIWVLPIAVLELPDNGSRRGMLLVSHDEGDTWEYAFSSSGTVLSIDNTGTGAIAQVVVEPFMERDSAFQLWFKYRNKDGYQNGRIITRQGGYFNAGALQNVLPAPASTSHGIPLPKIGKWIAAHNDRADGIEGAGARKKLILSISNSGQAGTYTQALILYNGEYVFEPTIEDAPNLNGVFLTYTTFEVNKYRLIARFISYDNLLNSGSEP